MGKEAFFVNTKLKRLLGKNEFYVALIIVLLAGVIQAASGLFFAVNNLVDLFRAITVNAIYALCALFAFVSTGADVSFPMIAGMSTYIIFKLGETTSLPAIALVLIALLIGAVCGCINGFFIVRFHFNALIVTLSTSSICYGIAFGALKGVRINVPDALSGFANWNILKVTSAQTGLGASLHGAFIVMLVLYLAAYLVLDHTMVGRAIYAIGGDEVSARRAGFKVDQIRFGVFVVNGIIAAIGGICYACMCRNCSPMEYYGGDRHRGHRAGRRPADRRARLSLGLPAGDLPSGDGVQFVDDGGRVRLLSERLSWHHHHPGRLHRGHPGDEVYDGGP